MRSLLKWWLMLCLIILGIGISIFFNLHIYLFNEDITKKTTETAITLCLLISNSDFLAPSILMLSEFKDFTSDKIIFLSHFVFSKKLEYLLSYCLLRLVFQRFLVFQFYFLISL